MPRAALLPVAALCALSLRGAAAAPSSSPAPPPALRPILVTIDDLPVAAPRLHSDPRDRAEVTRDLLAVLSRHCVPAVGFVIWGQVGGDADRALLRRWLDAGHLLGNHSFSHPDLTRLEAEAFIADVERGRAGLAGFLEPLGGAARLFRYPFLDEGDTRDKLEAVRRYLERSGQRAVPVTIDDQDWSFETSYVEARRRGDRRESAAVAADALAALRLAVLHHEKSGDAVLGRRTPQILLLHANAVGAATWDDLFGWLEATGHRFAPADEVLADDAFAHPPDFVAPSGCSLWDRIAAVRSEDEARAAVLRLIAAQTEAWNRGDLASFCSVYADDARFLSPSGSWSGREAVLERYRARYPDRAAMGTLRLDVDEVRPLWGMEVTPALDAVPGTIHAASVAARWTLTYADRPPASGRTLLVLRRAPDGWVIVQDASM